MPGAQIVHAVDVVDDRERRDVVEERVDREVAAECVFLRRAERVVVVTRARVVNRAPATPSCDDLLAWLQLPPERRDLDDLVAELDVREPEAAADDPAVAEQLLDLIRVGRRADVEVLGTARQEQVAHAAADEIRDVIELTQAVENLQRVGVDVAARDRVLGARDDARLSHRGHCTKTAASTARKYLCFQAVNRCGACVTMAR